MNCASPDHQRRIVDPEISPAVVAQLRIARSRPRRIAVENTADQGQMLVYIGAQARTERGQRRRRAATWQIN
jgi:hypothetical protein